MINRLIFKVLILLIFLSASYNLLATKTYAAGDLTIDWGAPNPFDVYNMLPGDEADKDISITNDASVERMIAIKGELVSEEKNFPDILEIEITMDSNFIYGGPSDPKTLRQFLNDSSSANGILLFPLSPGETAVFNVKVKFPWFAGNEYQNAKVVFNLLLGIARANNIVINEVYYDVDSAHGFDSPKDRGILDIHGNNATIVIKDNATGSTNEVEVSLFELCQIVQTNNGDIRNVVDIYTNSGGNNANSNNANVTIFTGFSRAIFNLANKLNFNIGNCNGRKLGLNHEWVELYNPTDDDVSLKDWVLEDDSGEETVIHANKTIKAGGFALISKDASFWKYWDEDPDAIKVEVGRNIGDGLGDDGDHLYLISPEGEKIDAVAWQNDTEVWNPSITDVIEGHSIERTSPGFDTDTVSDWYDNDTPSPGL